MQIQPRVQRPQALQQLDLVFEKVFVFGDQYRFAHGANRQMHISQERMNVSSDCKKGDFVLMPVMARGQIIAATTQLQPL